MPFQFPTTAPALKHKPAAKAMAAKGSPAERLWIIAETPLSKDGEAGYLFGSPMGWSFDKLLKEVGIERYYITYVGALNVETEEKFISHVNQFMPPVIVALDGAGKFLLPKIVKGAESLQKCAGSLYVSEKLSYPHYIIPTFGPEYCVRDWTERQVVKYVDLAKALGELNYWKENHKLQPLPEKALITDLDDDFPRLLDKIRGWKSPSIEYLSIDLEAIYPKAKSEFKGHPGYAITCGIAPNPTYGYSFELFRESTRETAFLWKALGDLIADKNIIGQNFHSFDAWHVGMLGMPVNRFKIFDTMYRHAVLWPELPHKLQFQTRQYTRQPYYKDEGHHWKPGELHRLKRYNCLDVVTTYDIFLAQEEEFNERPHLR